MTTPTSIGGFCYFLPATMVIFNLYVAMPRRRPSALARQAPAPSGFVPDDEAVDVMRCFD
jgi:hypothetical protein